MAALEFTGIIPPMITPFGESGDVDYEAFARNIEKWNTTGLRGYLVMGSNSEAVYLTETEKLRLVELTAQTAASGKLVLAGTAMESTRETIHLTNAAARVGAQAALILPPFYYGGKMTDEALIRHFQEVANHADIPVLLYNMPLYTHLNMSPKVIGILSRHPNIIGMKDSLGSITQLVEFQQASESEDFQILVGTASVWYPALSLGIRGGIQALANCAPEECVRVQQLYNDGSMQEAEALYRRLYPVNKAVTATFGIAGLKYACTLCGYTGGSVRSPLLEMDRAAKEQLEGILRKAGLIS